MIVYSKHAVSIQMSCPRTSAQKSGEIFLPVVSKLHDNPIKSWTARLPLIQEFLSKHTIGRVFAMATDGLVSYLARGIWN